MKYFMLIGSLAVLLAVSTGSAKCAPQGQTPPPYFKTYAGLVWNPHDVYYQTAQKEVTRSVLSIIVQDQQELDHGLRFHKLIRGAPQIREVALTFDDGPHEAYTPQLLAILRQYNVKATFFVVGERAEQYPDLVREEVAEGNEVGNHTYHHMNLTKLTPAQAATEIKACGEVVHMITGHCPHLFRPPGGDYNTQVAAYAEAMGYTTVLWTDDPGDFKRPGDDVIVQRTIDHLCPGAVILLHDGIQQTIDVLPEIIQHIRAEGYKIVTVDQLIRDRDHTATSDRMEAKKTKPVDHLPPAGEQP